MSDEEEIPRYKKSIKIATSEDELELITKAPQLRKRKEKREKSKLQLEKYTEAAVVSNESMSCNQLALHKKKLLELQGWFDAPSKLLILHGPSGCSKTTSLRCICHERNIDVIEWLDNPLTNYSESFRNFFRNALKFPSTSGRKKIILVKDLMLLDMLEIIKLIESHGRFPVVFITNEEIIKVPVKDWIVQIKFNKIAPTIMKKALKRLYPSFTLCDSLVEIAMGDLRFAINCIEFLGVKKCTPQDLLLCSRDESAGLFHLLGKIFHSKEKSLASITEFLDFLHEESSLLPLYIHEHYMTFYDDLEAIGCISDSLSSNCYFDNFLFHEWKSAYSLIHVDFLFHSKESKRLFKSFSKPVYFDKQREQFVNEECIKRNCWMRRDEYLDYLLVRPQ